MVAAAHRSPPMHESHLSGLRRLHQGKVRDIYEIDARHMLIVTTDRLSAFDVAADGTLTATGKVFKLQKPVALLQI